MKKVMVCLLALMLLGANVAAVADSGIKVMIMPASLQIIEEEAFYGNTSIEKIVIQEGVTEICSKAFVNCSSLVSVKLPESLARIENAAFEGCTGLEEINLPPNIEFIAEGVFDSCPNVVVTVVESSYAAEWCKKEGINVEFAEDDWGMGEF